MAGLYERREGVIWFGTCDRVAFLCFPCVGLTRLCSLASLVCKFVSFLSLFLCVCLSLPPSPHFPCVLLSFGFLPYRLFSCNICISTELQRDGLSIIGQSRNDLFYLYSGVPREIEYISQYNLHLDETSCRSLCVVTSCSCHRRVRNQHVVGCIFLPGPRYLLESYGKDTPNYKNLFELLLIIV